jgi:hypothetical protein
VESKEVNEEILLRLHRVEVLKKNDQELHELIMEEQRLKIDIAKNQLVFQKRMQVLEEEFLKEKRTLELHLLKNMLSTPNLFQTLIKIIYVKCLSMKAAFIAFPIRFSGNGGSCICNAGGSPSSSATKDLHA